MNKTSLRHSHSACCEEDCRCPHVHVILLTDCLNNHDLDFAGRTPHEIARQEFSIELCVDQGYSADSWFRLPISRGNAGVDVASDADD